MPYIFQYPVIAVDEWCPVTNPFSHTHHGQLRVVLAMGSENQVMTFFFLRCGLIIFTLHEGKICKECHGCSGECINFFQERCSSAINLKLGVYVLRVTNIN